MTTKRLVLDRSHVAAIIGSSRFYTVCPAFVPIRDEALLAAQAYDASGTCCGGAWHILKPGVEAFLKILATAIEQDPVTIEQLREYLASKHGFIPSPVVIYYRAGPHGKPDRLSF